MSEAQFERIERMLERLDAGQKRLEASHAHLDAGQKRLEAGHERMDAGQERLEAGHTALHGEIRRVDGRITDLDRHMHVLHEQAMATIAATKEYSGPTKEEFAELKELISRRLDPLELAVRHHSVEIERLKG